MAVLVVLVLLIRSRNPNQQNLGFGLIGNLLAFGCIAALTGAFRLSMPSPQATTPGPVAAVVESRSSVDSAERRVVRRQPTAAFQEPLLVRVVGEMSEAERLRMESSVRHRIGIEPSTLPGVLVAIQTAVTDADPTVGGVSVASVSASWSATGGTLSSGLSGAIEPIEAFGASPSLARARAVDSAAVDIGADISRSLRRLARQR